jgi:hypothetical protein
MPTLLTVWESDEADALQTFIDTSAARLNVLKVSDGSPIVFITSMRQPPIPVFRAPIAVTAVMHVSAHNAEGAEGAIGRAIVLLDALKATGYHGSSTSTIIGGQPGLFVSGWDSVEVRAPVWI